MTCDNKIRNISKVTTSNDKLQMTKRNKRRGEAVMKSIMVAFLVAVVSQLHAGAGDAGAAFLKVPVDARVVGMGEAAAAYVDDASALYYNPAGLAKIEKIDLLFMHSEWLLGMNHEYFAGAFVFENIGTFGLSFNYWGSGTMAGVTIRGDTTYEFSMYDWTANLGYARDFGKLDIGFGFKFLSEKNESLSTWAVALDFGGMYDLPIKGLRAGVSLSNIGTSLKLDQDSYSLPILVRFGWRYNLMNLGFAQDFIISNADNLGVAVGAEYWVAEIMALRLGYRNGSDVDGISGLRAGLGIVLKGFGLDYGFAPYGRLGLTHRFSLSFKVIP